MNVHGRNFLIGFTELTACYEHYNLVNFVNPV
jgi:hypothetical protein